MKSIPQGKTEVLLIWCKHCEEWQIVTETDKDIEGPVTSEKYTSFHPDNSFWFSDYTGRYYFREGTDYYETEDWLYYCSEADEIVTNPDDDDPHDNRLGRYIPWKCSNCGHLWPNKNRADACCT